MNSYEHPQQIIETVDNLIFFSNFDSGNLAKVEKSSINSYDLFLSPDAASNNFSAYACWFHFGIKGLKKGNFIRLTLCNLNSPRPFSSPHYRPLYRSLPVQSEWQRISSEPLFDQIDGFFKYSWSYEPSSSDPEHYFAFATPYPYGEIQKSLSYFESLCPTDCHFHREVLVKSLDGRDIDLVTISHKSNFGKVREERLKNLFPSSTPRSFTSLKPVIFISSRVHPGETPSSFMLDQIIQAILKKDSRGAALRNNFVFKIVPVLNPDGVFRGNFRVDQRGVNLNRCYINPSLYDQPSIYAVRSYFLSQSNIKFYFDLHAQMSKKSSFLFGNFLPDRQTENQIFAKLFELNCQFFDFSDCDFSQKSMSAKDPKDQNTKEGSGRVALYNASGVIHSYTVECSYHSTRPLHTIPYQANLKSRKKSSENLVVPGLVSVYNRSFFNDLALGLCMAVLDLEDLNENSRLPMSEFRNLDSIREYLKARNMIQNRILSRNFFKNESKTPEGRQLEKTTLPKIPLRKIHKLNVVSPLFNSLPKNIHQKPKVPNRTKSVLRP